MYWIILFFFAGIFRAEESDGFFLGGCNNATPDMLCKTQCDIGTIGRDGEINFRWMIKTERTLAAIITVQNRHLGYPRPADPYIGILRLDEKFCPRDVLEEIVQNRNVIVDIGDKTSSNHWLESIIYPRGIGEKWSRTAVFIQFRHGPQEPAELVSNNGQRDQLYIMVNHRYPTGQMDMEALESCFRKAHLSVLEDDGDAAFTSDYTRCAAYERYGLDVVWQESTGNDTDSDFGDFPTDNGEGENCSQEWFAAWWCHWDWCKEWFTDGVTYNKPVTVNGVMYENLGNFCDGAPWDLRGIRETTRIADPVKLDISYELITKGPDGELVYTQITDDNIGLIQNKETIFLTGGLEVTPSEWPWIDLAAERFFTKPKFDGNVIHFLWPGAASSYLTGFPLAITMGTWEDWLKTAYTVPAANARGAGRMLAYFIKKLYLNGVQPSNINLVGLSLGGEMIAYAGKSWNVIKKNMGLSDEYKIGKITAMDPAGPHFDYSKPLREGKVEQSDLEQIALWHTDATFVQVMHTNGNRGGPDVEGGNNIKLGLSRSVGHVDFFPSKTTELPGSRQLYGPVIPGDHCSDDLNRFGCDHGSSKHYFVASVTGDCLQGVKCIPVDNDNDHCAFQEDEFNIMGYNAVRPSERTDYYVPLYDSGGIEVIYKNASCRDPLTTTTTTTTTTSTTTTTVEATTTTTEPWLTSTIVESTGVETTIVTNTTNSTHEFGDFPTDNGEGENCPGEWFGEWWCNWDWCKDFVIDGVSHNTPVTVNGIFYENLGNFCDGAPWDLRGIRETVRVADPEGQDVSYKLITMVDGDLVYTQITDENLHIIENKETIFLTGGLEVTASEWPWIEESARRFYSKPDFDANIIQILWPGGASSYLNGFSLAIAFGTWEDFLKTAYTTPAANARGSGRMVAYFIKKLYLNGVHPANMNLVGLSLGGEMIAYVGKSWNVIKNNMGLSDEYKIGKITAMDPAGPHFDYSKPLREGKVDQSELEQIALWHTDATYVQVMHTNGNKGGDGVDGGNNIKLGLSRSVGHADFFPSKDTDLPGSRQLFGPTIPGSECNYEFNRFGCDHGASKHYFVSSITGNCLMGVRCRPVDHNNDHCAFHDNATNIMGYNSVRPDERTDYYVPLYNLNDVEVIYSNATCRS